jgi:ubiquitin carboxyl-terminal hydrolase L3
MSRFLQAGLTTNPREAAKVLETSDELERVYAKAAAQGDSVAPENPEASVDFHYVCFVRSTKSNHVYELDGERKGPLDRGEVEGGDLLDEQGLKLVRDFVGRGGESLGFNLMALSAG